MATPRSRKPQAREHTKPETPNVLDDDEIVWCRRCHERVAVSDIEPLCSLCSM